MLKEKLKNDLAIMRILKTNKLSYHIGMTDRNASIDLVITKDNPEYHFFIDASPLPDKENAAMLKIFNIQ